MELNIAASRLILVIMPGLETTAVFQASGVGLTKFLHKNTIFKHFHLV